MTNLEVFKNEEFGEVRTVLINNEPYFVGKDVALILGYTNPQKALRDHIDEEDKTRNESFTVNGTQGILINESGLYSLILSSKLPNAKNSNIGSQARYFQQFVNTECTQLMI